MQSISKSTSKIAACHTDDFPQYIFNLGTAPVDTIKSTVSFTITCADEYPPADTSVTSSAATCMDNGDLEKTNALFDCFDPLGE